MVFVRRASTLVRAVRPARAIRSAELQPWQRMVQRRTYASGHGPAQDGFSLKSDLPWMMGAIAATAGGLYIVVNQDTSHGEGHGGHGQHHDMPVKHDEAHEDEKEEEEAKEEQPKEEESKDDKEEEADKSEDKVEEGDDQSAAKVDQSNPEKRKEAGSEQTQSHSKPSDTDVPDAHKGKPKNTNEMSGKQDATYSNEEAKHPMPISKMDDKSKKGEGMAETAKVQGTVSTERPDAANKSERGKREADKNA